MEKEKYTAELSSAQLVYGVAILLCFGVACFALGVVVGRFEPSVPQVAKSPGNDGATVFTPEEKSPATSTARNDPGHSSIPGAMGRTVPDRPGRPQTATVNPPRSSSPRHVERLPAPAPADSPAVEHPTGAASPGAVSVATDATPNSPPATPEEPVSARIDPVVPAPQSSEDANPPALHALEPEESTPESTPVVSTQPPTPETAATAAAIPESAGGEWTVRLGVFSQRENAEKLAARLRAKTSITPFVLDSPNGRSVVVTAGAFATRDEAEKARGTLFQLELAEPGSYVTKRSN